MAMTVYLCQIENVSVFSPLIAQPTSHFSTPAFFLSALFLGIKLKDTTRQVRTDIGSTNNTYLHQDKKESLTQFCWRAFLHLRSSKGQPFF